jgi:hypothetical protein
VYRMSTAPEFLAPLRAFKRRRLYANLAHDVMVPLGTAAFLSPAEVLELRTRLAGNTGVVHTISSEPSGLDSSPDGECIVVSDSSDPSSSGELTPSADERTCNGLLPLPVERMRRSLDSCGWEKVIISFKGLYGFLPMAHNQIAAVTKFGTLIDGLLGFHEGRHVMQHAADWLAKAEDK